LLLILDLGNFFRTYDDNELSNVKTGKKKTPGGATLGMAAGIAGDGWAAV
jgi:hypothetical protein